jgi:hypothetical protein
MTAFGPHLFAFRDTAMILIYTHIITPRLQYICDFIFKEQLHTPYRITNDETELANFDGPKINYSNKNLSSSFKIANSSLLFETGIKPKSIDCFDYNGSKAFFRIADSHFPFDIFAAVFYLLSRYEEYLPHNKDMYDRYAHENSLAFKEGFLHQPLANSWIIDFTNALRVAFPAFHFSLLTFNFLPTYDIDIAYSYKHKGFKRNIGGFLRSPSLERLRVLTSTEHDPYDSYDFLHQLHDKYKLLPAYFFLVATQQGQYDKNIDPSKIEMQQLIKEHASRYTIGLHPSWISNDRPAMLQSEKQLLESVAEKQIVHSRQHYIKLTLPETYQRLIKAGIEHDYSMGYGSINGFRASVASSFYWYDLSAEKQTTLQIHPFCFMDANSHYEQHQTPEESYKELLHYYHVCRKANGTLITIFHNNFLGDGNEFRGWRKIFQKFIEQVYNN